jgi:hypothetical protein
MPTTETTAQELLSRAATAVECGPILAMPELRLAAEALCRAVAGELAGVPLYLLLQSELPAELGGDSVCGAFTQPALCWHVRRHLGDGWRGPGPTVVFNDRKITQEHAPDFVAVAFLGYAIHELGHVLAGDWLPWIRFSRKPNRKEAAQLAEVIGEASTIDAALLMADGRRTHFLNHDGPWIRTVCHLRYRAEAFAGIRIPASRLFRFHNLFRPETYELSLSDEPARMARVSIADVLAAPMPDHFAALWEENLQDFDRNEAEIDTCRREWAAVPAEVQAQLTVQIKHDYPDLEPDWPAFHFVAVERARATIASLAG